MDPLDKSLEQLRTLREQAASLHSSIVDDLRPFLNGPKPTFRRLPTSKVAPGDAKVTTTCTTLMALAATRKLHHFYAAKGPSNKGPSKEPKEKAFQAIKLAVKDETWATAELEPDDAFTANMVLRTAGMLAKHSGIEVDKLLGLPHRQIPLGEILLQRIYEPLESLRVSKYEPTPTIGYWFLDAIDALSFADQVPQETWSALIDWAAKEFTNQISLLIARHESAMDPVAMVMAACIISRLRRVLNGLHQDWALDLLKPLPSKIEIRAGVRRFFDEQAPSGIWPKYFPLFHYPAMGSNFPFTFEVLEAILNEFGSDQVIEEPVVLERLERSVLWCKSNRLECRHKGTWYRGWHSGGELSSVIQGLPESWATGVVHMFLSQLCGVLSGVIERRLLVRYHAEPSCDKNTESWNDLLSTKIELQSKSPTTVCELLEEKMLGNLKAVAGLDEKIRNKHSALLFGPPGTSKTNLVKAFAKAAGWPYVEINPSHFLSEGLDKIYNRANQIFKDLMDMSNVVVLFDEMDTLVRRRPGDAAEQPLDVTREFLTTSMLPMLADLHRKARIIFFMATNHQRSFDEAIKRSGRFDLHVFMGVPSWSEKRKEIHRFISGLPEKGKATRLRQLKQTLDAWLKEHDDVRLLLDFFSFLEMRSFFLDFIGQEGLDGAFANENAEKFRESVREWGQQVIALREYENPDAAFEKRRRNELRVEYEEDRKKSRVQ